MSIVECRLPKAGLGNQLFPLLQAHLFGLLNALPVVVTGYHQLKLGPWLRGEKSKRNYNGFFEFQEHLLIDLYKTFKYRNSGLVKDNQPPLEVLLADEKQDRHFIFGQLPHYTDYFKGLKENREEVIKLFYKLVRPAILSRLSNLPAPCIGVHIRMGDYKSSSAEAEFGKVGAVRTPLSYFLETINTIRQIHGSNLPVSIFTDGHGEELKQLLSLENTYLVKTDNDLLDLLLLSRSRILVTSADSTFSYWSAFLSAALVIMHPLYIFSALRPEKINATYYEGSLDVKNLRLLELIKSLA